jgi:putative esterase
MTPKASLIAILVLAAPLFGQVDRQPSLRFQIRVDPAVASGPVSGRLIVFMTNRSDRVDVIEPAFGEHAADTWVTAREIQSVAPGDAVDIDGDDIAAPGPLSSAPSGEYQVMALLDTDHNAAFATITAADLRSKVMTITHQAQTADDAVTLTLEERGTEPPIELPSGTRAIDFVSPSLSSFWGRPIHMRAFVVVPPGYERGRARYPTAYITQGFSGYVAGFVGYFGTMIATRMSDGSMPPMIWVLLDESFTSGTHEFVDSVNNGPWGRALTSELIPYLERQFRMDANRSGRLLNGHSSGGWATLWLQVNYPALFGGTWSSSPDPTDFHDFLGVDLASDENLYHAPDGAARPLVRIGGRPVQTVEQFAKQEAVLGEYGGQMSSFEWVFSPRGPDGRPLPLFDRVRGDIRHDVAAYWREHYDLSYLLATNASRLVPSLRGRLHVVAGTEDTFYLDRAARRLQQTIEPLGYQPRFTYLSGRNHFDLYEPDLMARIAAQMYAVARPGSHWTSKVPLDPRTALTP